MSKSNLHLNLRRVLAAVLVLVALVLMWKLVGANIKVWLRSLLDHVAGWGVAGMVGFVVVYILAAMFFIPASILTLGAGAVYGVGKGILLVAIGASTGAALSFLVGRHFARRWVEERINQSPVFLAIERAVDEEGWKVVLLARLSPVFPFAFLNYGFGLTQVGFREYLVASVAGIIPATSLYVYIGSLARAGTEHRTRTPLEWVFYIGGLVATLIIAVLITRRARRELARRAPELKKTDPELAATSISSGKPRT
ncbi:MAG TPA: TVP38/TMEM64 family protein [Roseimicrobium sp.]|nr:TVP38/TMEM64 family protein [Roseimicrobium sp.]